MTKKLRPKQAAEIIGCTVGTVRTMIREGRMKATEKPDPFKAGCIVYEITEREVQRVKNLEQTVGFPRGSKRK